MLIFMGRNSIKAVCSKMREKLPFSLEFIDWKSKLIGISSHFANDLLSSLKCSLKSSNIKFLPRTKRFFLSETFIFACLVQFIIAFQWIWLSIEIELTSKCNSIANGIRDILLLELNLRSWECGEIERERL